MFKKLKKAYNSYKEKLGLNTEKPGNTHLTNLKNNEVIHIDGKPFVKIKLHFVDTYDANTSKIIENLEVENTYLNYQVQNLLQKIDIGITKSKTLETLNINLCKEKRFDEEKLIAELATLKKANKEQNNKLTKVKSEVISKNTVNDQLLAEIEQLKIRVKQKNDEIKSLNNKFREFNATLHSITNNNTKVFNMITEEHKSDLSLKNKKIEQQEALIQTLTNKIFEKETQIKSLTENFNIEI